MERADVVIAGAGIIGLSLALELTLASPGMKIVVLDSGRAMAESSWAAAGMLAANDPENPPQLGQLARLSLDLYPGYLSSIERLSGRKVPLRSQATLQAIKNEHLTPPAIATLTPAELHTLEPGLHPGNRSFILLEEASLDPRDLCAVLPLAAKAAGVILREENPVLCVDATATGVLLQTPTTAIAAAHFINCAGAWAESPALGRLPTGHTRIAPRKGQMTTVHLDKREIPNREILTHVIRTPEIYLVPRGDGRITIGATVEHAGFDKTVQPQAIATLLKAAAELWPPIAHAEILESWAGLRPGSTDELPLIGPTTNMGALSCGSSAGWEAQISSPANTNPNTQPNLWIAAGHFRNGILLAPGTARAVAQLIRGESPEIDLTPFAPVRPTPANTRPLDRLVPSASDNRATAAL